MSEHCVLQLFIESESESVVVERLWKVAYDVISGNEVPVQCFSWNKQLNNMSSGKDTASFQEKENESLYFLIPELTIWPKQIKFYRLVTGLKPCEKII